MGGDHGRTLSPRERSEIRARIAVTVYVLVAIIRKRLDIERELYTL